MPRTTKTNTAKNAPVEVINNIETKELKENTQYIVKMPPTAKKSSKKQTEPKAEEIPPIVEIVEEPKIEIVEEEKPPEQLVGAEESEEEDEEDRIIREAQARKALKNKSKLDEIEAKINAIVGEINIKYDPQIKEAQQILNRLTLQRDKETQEYTRELREQKEKYKMPEPIQREAKKRGGGGKFENLQSKDGETHYYHERGIKQVYYRNKIIYVGEKTFTIEGRAETYNSLNKAVEGHYIHFLGKKGNCSIWSNIYYDDKQSGTKQKLECLKLK